MSHHNKDSTPPDARRRPRIEVDGYCFLRDISHAVPLEIINISLGGMQLCAAEAMRIGELRVILATLEPGLTVELRATVAHCAPWVGLPGRYRVGVAFAENDMVTMKHAVALIKHLTAVPALFAVK